MSKFSTLTKVYILSTITIGLALAFLYLPGLDWGNIGLYLLAALAALGQVFKVEGQTDRSNYNIAWFIYGFTFISLGVQATFFVILVAHLVEWARHRYPWYIQCFNIGMYGIAITAGGWILQALSSEQASFSLTSTAGILASLGAFTLINHLMVGFVIWLARGENLVQSGVFESLTLIIDFTLIGLGAAAAMIWAINPSAVILTMIPLYLLYRALEVPALRRRVENAGV
jgi:hypothetical protein